MGPAMYQQATATFTHPDWIRAISAHLPGANLFQLPATGFPRLSASLKPVSLPVRHFDSWVTPLTNGGLPAAAPGGEDAVIDLLDAIESPVLFRNIPVEHPVGCAILSQATHINVITSWERAGLEVSGTYEEWLSRNFNQHRRKEFKRLRARLAERGEFAVRSLEPKGDLASFIENFLALEKSGWKGERGTAIANDPKLADALRNGLTAMHARGRVRFWEMTLDGKPIASLYALIDGGEASLGKIAHDEQWAKYSPGVLIILEATQSFFAEDGITFADSNAIPGHPMIDRIWRDRIACMDVLVAGPRVPSSTFALLSTFMQARHELRGLAKRAFIRLTGRKVS
jgi:CelD/BcsL family acetyltransferase involved in cellulose biosynthesis